MLKFEITSQIPGELGRSGVITTKNGVIKTPAFVVVATQAAVKGAVSTDDLKSIGAQIVLGNTYHLYLRPGSDVVKKAGGLANFMNWNGPTMTDSGGFQVFSLGFAYKKGVSKVAKESFSEEELNKSQSQHQKLAFVDDDGVTFKSHIDGSEHRFTPEFSIQVQQDIGADIIFAFDECTSPLVDKSYMKKSLERTHLWAKRSLDAKTTDQSLFGIVQGGKYEDLRIESAKYISSLPFDGFGIGGSFDKSDMLNLVEVVNKILPENKPRHMLGIGEIEDIFEGVQRGIDLYDCVLPTRLARHGMLFSENGKFAIIRSKYKSDFSAVVDGCNCFVCQNYTKAYLYHLFKAKEMLAFRLASIHNLYFMMNLMEKIRDAIKQKNFLDFKEEFLKRYNKQRL